LISLSKLDWREFLNLMSAIRAKTLKEKIDLFIKIADEDGNCRLSRQEISNLCMIALKRFVLDKGEGMIEDLCDYFTKLIFISCKVNIEEEIPLERIKEVILNGEENSDLLAFFCGADI